MHTITHMLHVLYLTYIAFAVVISGTYGVYIILASFVQAGSAIYTAVRQWVVGRAWVYKLLRAVGYSKRYAIARTCYIPVQQIDSLLSRVLGCLLVACVLGGCSSLPTAPSTTPVVAAMPVQGPSPAAPTTTVLDPLATHNIPATTADGSVVYVCATQPRVYCGMAGACSTAIDHYIQQGVCPVIPID